MAEELTDYAFPGRGRHQKYPWDLWLNGSPWRLIRGVDFQSKATTFQANLMKVRDRFHVKIKSHVESDTEIVIQCLDAPAESGSEGPAGSTDGAGGT